jgi:hypothetical protein
MESHFELITLYMTREAIPSNDLLKHTIINDKSLK